jgi:hypothetical protein
MTCSGDSYNNCLTCDSSKNRILNGTKCDCDPNSLNLEGNCHSQSLDCEK